MYWKNFYDVKKEIKNSWLILESIKALKIKTSKLFSLDFDSNTILSCFFFFFFIYWLILFNSCSYYKTFNPIVELVFPIGISTKEGKAEMDTHPVFLEITLSGWSI